MILPTSLGLTCQVDVVLAGRRLRLCADDESLVARLMDDLRSYCLEAALDNSQQSADAKLVIYRCRSAPDWPQDDGAYTSMELAQGECLVSKDCFHLRVDGVTVVSGMRPDSSVELYAAQGSLGEQRQALNMAFVHALHAALRRTRCFALHAAGLVEPVQRQGVLVVGASGAGKTTLTMRLAEQGWQYLSDDYHLLAEQNSLVQAWPWRRVFTVTEQTLAACASTQLAAATGSPLLQDANKRCVTPERLFAQASLAQTVPRHLLFNHLSGEPATRLIPITQAKALTKLIRQSPWSCHDPFTYREHLALLTALTRQCQTWQLAAGTDWLTSPERAAAILTEQLQL